MMTTKEGAIPVYIWTEPDILTEHRLDEAVSVTNGDTTVCGIAWIDLPLNVYTGGKTFEGDKSWYTDHERDDVVRCAAGCWQ